MHICGDEIAMLGGLLGMGAGAWLWLKGWFCTVVLRQQVCEKHDHSHQEEKASASGDAA